MEDDNIFDEDDALDYVIYEKLEENSISKKSGCFTVVLFVLIIPIGVFLNILIY